MLPNYQSRNQAFVTRYRRNRRKGEGVVDYWRRHNPGKAEDEYPSWLAPDIRRRQAARYRRNRLNPGTTTDGRRIS